MKIFEQINDVQENEYFINRIIFFLYKKYKEFGKYFSVKSLLLYTLKFIVPFDCGNFNNQDKHCKSLKMKVSYLIRQLYRFGYLTKRSKHVYTIIPEKISFILKILECKYNKINQICKIDLDGNCNFQLCRYCKYHLRELIKNVRK